MAKYWINVFWHPWLPLLVSCGIYGLLAGVLRWHQRANTRSSLGPSFEHAQKFSAGNLYLRTHLRVRSVWSARQVRELPEAKIVPRNLLTRLFRFDATLPSVRNDINYLRHLIVDIHILVSLAYTYSRNILRRHTSFQPIYPHLYCSFQVKWYHTDIISEK